MKRLVLVAVLVAVAALVVVYQRRFNQVREAKRLSELLLIQSPSVRDVLLEERQVANALKITLEETAQDRPEEFDKSLKGYVVKLVSLRDRRKAILQKIERPAWSSPLVNVVLHVAAVEMKDQISRTEAWMEMAHNISLRSEFGHKGESPELRLLNRQLDIFLVMPMEDALLDPVHFLQEEYRLNEAGANK